MNQAPSSIIEKLRYGKNLVTADLVTVNLGDAYGTGDDYILYLTNNGYDLSKDTITYVHDNNLVELEGISRKASTGSDKIDISFSVTDEVLLDAIEARRYANKKCQIDRVILNDVGMIDENYAITVRAAWAISHQITGSKNDRTVTLTVDSSLGDLTSDNGWYAIDSSHQKRYPGDRIMRWSATVFTDEQKKRYSTDFTGTISSDVKPPALPVIYGYKNVEAVPICQLQHRKSHTFYRHYFTTWIYVIGIGEMTQIFDKNLRRDGDDVDMFHVKSQESDIGGWSFRIMRPSDNIEPIADNRDLWFWTEQMDFNEIQRLDGMIGRGLTLMFVKNRNRDNWIQRPPTFTIPVMGTQVYDPRDQLMKFSRNPALQYADFLRNTDYGVGGRGIAVSDANIAALADHFDQLPGSVGNPGINDIRMDIQLDTGEPFSDNMNIWIKGARLYTSDYYGEYLIRVETIGTPVLTIHESELEDEFEYESGEFTERITRLTYKIKQLVPDTSQDAEAGDLVEVDVESTFPVIGSQTYNDWLVEDGGIENFESAELDYVTELEQAFYWTMVDARTSRKPDTLTLPLGPIAWLLETGDIINFVETRKTEGTLWRVVSVEESDPETAMSDVELVPYADEFYLPDPAAIPAPPDYARPPKQDLLNGVVAVSVTNIQDSYYLNFAETDENVSFYSIEIQDRNDNFNLVYANPRLIAPPLLLLDISAGDYTASIVANGINKNEGPEVKYDFSIANLTTSTSTPLIVGTVPGRIIVEPPTPLFENRTYEWRYATSTDPTLVYWGDGRVLNLTPIVENVTYIIEYRLKSTVSNVVPGDWVEVQVDGVEQTVYTWVAYADDDQGTGISLSPVGKDYYGVATGRTNATPDITNPSIYGWFLQPTGTGGTGEPAVSAVLSNESHGIPANESGVALTYDGAVTTMKVLIGLADDTSAFNISASASTGVTGSLVGATYTVTQMTTLNGFVDLTATRTGYPTVTKRFTLTKLREGSTGPQGPIGPSGPQGVEGPVGPNGQTTYTWIKYADSATGTGLSNDPTGKTYIGFAYNKTTATESTNPALYTWSLIQGPQGNQGVPGPVGPNGQTTYTWIKYAANSTGTSGFSDTPLSNTAYIGIRPNNTTATESTNPALYTWSLFKGPQGDTGPQGLQGLQGPQGNQGIAGPTGPSGQTSYFHVAYSNSATGTVDFTTGAPGTRTYIGTYVDFNPTDSTNPAAYQWVKIQGAQGPQGNQGIPGVGQDGQTSYLHIAYANNATGTSGFTTGNWTNQTYIGQYTDFLVNDSTNPALYTWSRFVGADGPQGPKGDTGNAGAPGQSLYVIYNSTSNTPGTPTGAGTADGWGYTLLSTSKWASQIISPDDPRTNGRNNSWSIPYRLVGADGPQGPVGPEGPPGPSSPDVYDQTDDASGSSTLIGSWITVMTISLPQGVGSFNQTFNLSTSGLLLEDTGGGGPIGIGDTLPARLDIRFMSGATQVEIVSSAVSENPSLVFSRTPSTYANSTAPTYSIQARIVSTSASPVAAGSTWYYNGNWIARRN